ncbi:hypothetical protein F5Y16DRAFT_252566 [Xylariaceae sp. FL0255]|nr:hypothetical protein F5Y16DRAFT_252566 [Xylariaceae sp. FL0255]
MAGVTASGGKLQGYAYIVLHVIRFCNVFVLVAVMAASILMLAFARLPDAYQFFSDIIHVLVFCFAAILIFTEIGLWERGQRFVAAAWPFLGAERSFTGLGAVMLLIGCHLLGGLSDGIYFASNVPSQIPQVILGAGIIALTFGIVNVIASFLFRGPKLKAREIRRKGATTKAYTYDNGPGVFRKISHPIMPDLEKGDSEYANSIDDRDVQSHTGYYEPEEDKIPIVDRRSPVAPCDEIQRPPTAMHPIHQRATTYSLASNMPHPGHPGHI